MQGLNLIHVNLVFHSAVNSNSMMITISIPSSLLSASASSLSSSSLLMKLLSNTSCFSVQLLYMTEVNGKELRNCTHKWTTKVTQYYDHFISVSPCDNDNIIKTLVLLQLLLLASLWLKYNAIIIITIIIITSSPENYWCYYCL